MPVPIPAIVLGLDLNGLGVVRALGQACIPVIGMDHLRGHVGRASRFCKEVIEANPCSKEAVLEALRSLSRKLDGPAVLFPTMDDTVRILSEGREELPSSCRYGLPDAPTVRLLMEKEDLVELARRHSWPAPTSVVCRSETEILEASKWFPCPGVLKPGRRDLGAPRGIPRKLWSFTGPEDLIESYRALAQWEATAVLQEIIPGPDSAVLFCLFYADARSQVRVHFTGRKIRQFPPLYGSTASAEPLEDGRLAEFARQFVRDVAYRGLGSVEMKLDARSGRLLLTEPTVGRTDYQSFLAVANGVNIPEVAYRDLAGLDPAPSLQRSRKVKYVVGLSDFRSARSQIREGRETWRGYLSSLRGPKIFALVQPRDPGPFLYRVHYATTGRLLRVLKRALLRAGGRPRKEGTG